jgi:hypothetical protein
MAESTSAEPLSGRAWREDHVFLWNLNPEQGADTVFKIRLIQSFRNGVFIKFLDEWILRFIKLI